MRTFKALIKREFWEHKGAMFYTPVIMAGVFAVLMIISGITGNAVEFGPSDSVNFDNKLPDAVAMFESADDAMKEKIVSGALYGSGTMFGFISLFIALFYALGSLYDERKDRSILFWKSMPVSDTETVLSKVVSIAIVLPLLYAAVIVAFQMFILIYFTVAAWFGGSSGASLWGATNLFAVFFNSFVSMLVASIWMAPFWGWLMLASAWSKKVPFIWAGIPIFVLSIGEAWVFGSARFIEMVGVRIAKAIAIQNNGIQTIASEGPFDGGEAFGYSEALTSTGLWVGLVVGAAFLAAAIYTRRYRDEA